MIVITHRLWKRHFNSDPNVIGKTLILDQKPATVIGVLPKEFDTGGRPIDAVTVLDPASIPK